MIDGFGRPQSALVLGGGSDLARATMSRLVASGCRRVVLAGRPGSALAEAAARLGDDGAEVTRLDYDATDVDAHDRVVGEAVARVGDLDLVLVAFAALGERFDLDTEPRAAAQLMAVNSGGGVAASLAAARRLRDQGHGTLVVLSSVVVARPRVANLVYAAGKAGLDSFALGLGDALAGSGARVMIVRPGYVPTKMTAGRAPMPLATTPEAVARAIERGLARRSRVVWVPAVLRPAAAVLKALPPPLWRRLADR